MDPVASLVNANWVDIKTDTYSTVTGNEYTTFSGVFTAIRFKQEKTAGTSKNLSSYLCYSKHYAE